MNPTGSRIDQAMMSNQAYTDIQGVQKIRQLGHSDERAAIAEVAKQFESMFLQMVMKSMRAAGEIFASDSPFNSFEMRFHQDMLDQQTALSLSEGRGIGLAAALTQQMTRNYGLDAPAQQPSKQQFAVAAYQANPRQLEQTPTVLQLMQRMSDAMTARVQPGAALETTSNNSETVTQKDTETTQSFATPEDFVSALWPLAEKIGAQLGVSPKVLIAQSALETGWGKSVDQLGHNNFFGIKADARWQGEVQRLPTLEYRHGVAEQRREAFRAYADEQASFSDYAEFISNNPRYQQALQHADNPYRYVEELQKAGYATDPHYAAKVQRIMDSDSLNDSLSTLMSESMESAL